MTFTKDQNYFKNKISNIKKAITGNKKELQDALSRGDQRSIDAHESYLDSLNKNLTKAQQEYTFFLMYN